MRRNVGTRAPQALETEKRDAEERVRELQAKTAAELGGGGETGGEAGGAAAADDFDRGGTGGSGGGSEVEVLQRELSLTLTELAKVSTEVRKKECATRSMHARMHDTT